MIIAETQSILSEQNNQSSVTVTYKEIMATIKVDVTAIRYQRTYIWKADLITLEKVMHIFLLI